MTNQKIQFVGSPCGQHGTYTFYKAFKYTLDGKQRILTLGEFFLLKIWEDEDIISVGEAQLFWEDKSSGQILVSLRLYFLPENTPDGRKDDHGEHEIVSLVDKVILRAEDVVNVMGAASDVKWQTGLLGVFGDRNLPCKATEKSHMFSPAITDSLDMNDVMREKILVGDVVEEHTKQIIVLPYNRYCRFRALLKRIEGMTEDYLKQSIVVALGGFFVASRNTRLIYCKDVFEYPELEGHDLLCNHLAPKLQGRPRKKKRRRHESEESGESSSADEQRPWLKVKPSLSAKHNSLIRGIKPNHLHIKPPPAQSIEKYCQQLNTKDMQSWLEAEFTAKLLQFMKERGTPINRVPNVGNKPLNFYRIFGRIQELGGYEQVSQRRQWKMIFDEIVGRSSQPQHLTSQTVSYGVNSLRKQYERCLLPYESYILQEQKLHFEKKMALKPRRQPHPAQHLQANLQQLPHLPMHETQKFKEESCEPSVSILQPDAANAVGASFEVADGGSTTITLIAVSEEQTVVQPNTPTATSPTSERSSPCVGPSSPTLTAQLTIPKIPVKKDSLSNDLAKRPEITITPIPRASAGMGNASMQLTDLMSMNLNMSGPFGVTALQDLAKIAERCDRYGNPDPAHARKKFKHENSTSRLNGNSGAWDRHHESHLNKPAPQHAVPDLISNDIFRQMNMLESTSKMLLPAHQSSKTINSISSLLPQTSIYPAPPAPAAHQHIRPAHKYDNNRPEPVFQTQSAYSQSKHVYGKPTTSIKDPIMDRYKNRSPELEILDLRTTHDNKGRHSRSDKLEIELLDLSTRKDITVSAVPKSSHSKHATLIRSQQPSHVSIKSAEVSVMSASNPTNHYSSPQSRMGGASNPLLAALAAQTLPPSTMASLAMPSSVHSSGILQYLMTNASKGSNSHPSSVPQLPNAGAPFMSMLDSANAAVYYNSLFGGGMLPSSSSVPSTTSNSAAVVAAAQQAASMAQLAQLSSLGLSAIPSVSHEAINNLGIYKNYLPSGPLPPPHFLSGLMSPGSSNNHAPNK